MGTSAACLPLTSTCLQPESDDVQVSAEEDNDGSMDDTALAVTTEQKADNCEVR